MIMKQDFWGFFELVLADCLQLYRDLLGIWNNTGLLEINYSKSLTYEVV